MIGHVSHVICEYSDAIGWLITRPAKNKRGVGFGWNFGRCLEEVDRFICCKLKSCLFKKAS